MGELIRLSDYRPRVFFLANARSPRCYHESPGCPELSDCDTPVALTKGDLDKLYPGLKPCRLCSANNEATGDETD